MALTGARHSPHYELNIATTMDREIPEASVVVTSVFTQNFC